MVKKNNIEKSPTQSSYDGSLRNISINLENCYGIKKLKTKLNFNERQLSLIYSANGSMKSSLARTFQDLSKGEDSKDRIFPERVTKRKILDSNGNSLNIESVFVIEPFNQDYKSSKISSLLVNKSLKKEYDEIYAEIGEKKETLLKELKKSSGLKNELETTFADDITHDPKEFFKSLNRVRVEILEREKSPLSNIVYNVIFNNKISSLIESADFQGKLTDYMQIYDQLIAKSTFFRKGVFNHNNAADIAKSLKQTGFFKADHSIVVSLQKKKKAINNVADLERIIQDEKNEILKDENLKKSFEEIDKKLIKNKEVKDFREYLELNQHILPELKNLPSFKQKLWVDYLIKNKSLYVELMEIYDKGKQRVDQIISQARTEETKWKKVINIFNDRFSVPFEVSVGNQDDVVLNKETPAIEFTFVEADGKSNVRVDEKKLWGVLSQGESRALYLLNIIFEVEARKESKQPTLFVIDDIADSFDYKNKYAIIEYLNDVSNIDFFYQLVLTHNFDFFRTLSSRLRVPRENKLHATKSVNEVKIIEELYQKNPFSHWKKNLSNAEMLIASIPFVRNLAEFCGLKNEYLSLTALLHIKSDTDSITVKDLENNFKNVLRDIATLTLANSTKSVKELIYDTATIILSDATEIVELEKKIVLSIAIRLKTEEFLIAQINDAVFLDQIETNQTIELIKKYKTLSSRKEEAICLAEQVNLMTPENIHINSFMYEPILDMANHHLKNLYRKVNSIFA